MKQSSIRPRLLFYAIAILLPFALLAFLELGLRASGFGQNYPLFVPSTQAQGYLQTNPEIIKRFFYPASTAPNVTPDTYIFAAEKPAETLRIITLGGSTMAGFPYGRFGSPAGMLKQRISATHPELNVEIISVAMSSINSFSILDFSDEVIAISPDAVLIYAGHNEYLGVMGVGSSFAGKGSYAANLLFLTLKEWRLYQLLQHIYYALLSPSANSEETLEDRTLMAQVAKEKDIRYQSELYEAGKAQFEKNLSLILHTFSSQNVPVYISTIASNLQDQAPFNSISEDTFDAAAIKINQQSRADSEPEQALNWDKLITENQQVFHADFAYALAHKYLNAGASNLAAKQFALARDYDLLRFRAPSEFNDIITQSTTAHQSHLVDANGALMRESEDGIIGNDLMLEHLHPNLRGYFVIAEAFYQSLIEHGTLPAPRYKVSSEQAWQWQPVSAVDNNYAALKIAQLMSDYPFTDEPSNITLADIDTAALSASDRALVEARIAGENFLAVQQQLIESLQREQRYLEAGLAAGVLFEALPNQHHLARIASLLLLRENVLPLAQFYAARAVTLAPSNSNYKLTLAEILFKLNRVSDAIYMLDEVIMQDPANTKAKQIKRAISQ